MSQDQSNLQSFGCRLHDWGANVTAIKKGTKQPAHKWKQWQSERQSREELDRLPWLGAVALGVINGSGSFRFFDIDARKDDQGKPIPVPESVVDTVLNACGLPDNYEWCWRSGSGAGWGIAVCCEEPLPHALGAAKGILRGKAKNGLDYDHLELRWSRGQTVIHGQHPSGPGYQWRMDRLPSGPPAQRVADQVAAAFMSIADIAAPNDTSHHLSDSASSIDGRYGQAALNHAIGTVSTAKRGERNSTLFRETASLAELVNGGELTRHEVERGMTTAAMYAGLGEPEIKRTVKSALDSVKKRRTAPDPGQMLPPNKVLDTREADSDESAPVDYLNYPAEDGGILDAWLDTCADNWIYVESEGWLRWTGTHWRRKGSELEVEKEIADLMAEMNGWARKRMANEPDEGQRKRLKAMVSSTRRSGSRVKSVERLARAARQITADQLDRTRALNLANGTLDLETLKLRDHCKDDLLTHCLPYGYDIKEEAPNWARVVDRFDPDVRAYLQEFSGYCLTPDTRHEVALWLCGPPGCGKSTFLVGLEAVLGPLVTTLSAADIKQSRFALDDLPGKRLVTASEQPSGHIEQTHIINAIISGESIRIDRKYRQPIVASPCAKLIWAMNSPPGIKSGNDGLIRRVKMVEFPDLAREDRLPDLKGLIVQEAPGILNWAVAGLSRLRSRGRFDVPAKVREATASFVDESDLPKLFLTECCECGDDLEIAGSDLYDAYVAWCKRNGHPYEANNVVTRDWERLGLVRKRKRRGSVWQGVRLLPGWQG